MARQLSLDVRFELNAAFDMSSAFDPEAQLAQLCQGREDTPAGMSRLAAS